MFTSSELESVGSRSRQSVWCGSRGRKIWRIRCSVCGAFSTFGLAAVGAGIFNAIEGLDWCCCRRAAGKSAGLSESDDVEREIGDTLGERGRGLIRLRWNDRSIGLGRPFVYGRDILSPAAMDAVWVGDSGLFLFNLCAWKKVEKTAFERASGAAILSVLLSLLMLFVFFPDASAFDSCGLTGVEARE